MTDKKRRQFVTIMGASAVAIPVSAVIGSLPSHASDMVDAESAEAKTWEYVTESAMADKVCNNCALYQGEAGSEAGGCPLFPGRQVAGAGWCKAYAPKPS